MSNETQKKNLSNTIDRLEKQYGKGILMKMGDRPNIKVETFSSGSLLLDTALGVGGYPRGRIIEIYGPESSGKTTLTLHAIAEMQKAGGVCAFIDAEHALDIRYAKKIGIDVSALYISQPSDGEQALEIADQLIRTEAVGLIVIDSVAALVPRAEIDGNMGDAQVALQARLMSQAMRKLTGGLSKSNTTIIFINQLRMKVGYVFGNPETTSGGNALKFYSSIRLDVRRMEQLKRGEENIGFRMKIKVVKNKVAPPFRQAETTMIYGEGVSRIYEVIEAGVKFDIIQKSGSWYSYGDQRLSQGVENLKNYLLETPDIFQEIEAKVREKLSTDEDDLEDEGSTTIAEIAKKNSKDASSVNDAEEKKLKAASKKIVL